MPPTPAKQTSDSDIPGIHSSENISLHVPALGEDARPQPVRFMSVHLMRSCPTALHPANRHSVAGLPQHTIVLYDTTSAQPPPRGR